MQIIKYMAIVTVVVKSLLAVDPMPIPKTDFSHGAGIALKSLMAKAPQELDPNLCVIVGTAYLEGSMESGVQRSTEKGLVYLKYASENNVILADAVLANYFLENRQLDQYAQSMQRVIFSGDEKIAVPAGLLLGNFYSEIGQTIDSVKTLRYVADHYGDSRAQFLAGYAIATGEYNATKRDGEFLIYQACINPKVDPVVVEKCALMGIGE